MKFNFGRYLEAAVNGNGNYSALLPSARIPTSVTRAWTDANGNFNPDCDLMNGGSQDLRGSGGDAWAFTRALRTGTPGITTVHAPNARRAFHSIEAMIKQSPEGRGYEPAEIHAQLRQSIGVICHAVRFLPSGPDERTRYRLTEVLEVGETAAEDRMVSAC